jgi:hypothetical protein
VKPLAHYAAAVETFKRYLVYQLVIFVFGIIGPIFLIVFFASQPDPTLKWMYWVGLFVTAADVLIALGLTAGSGPDKEPADTRVARAVANRSKSRRGSDLTSASSYDPISSTNAAFLASDAGSSSSDSGSSSSD